MTTNVTNDKVLETHELQKESARWESLLYLVGLIRGIYLSEKKVSMPYEQLVEKLCKKRKDQYLTTSYEMDQQLKLLESLVCKFLTIKSGKTLKIAKIDLKVDVCHVKNEILSHLQL
ncbi:hypothetical protein RFI_15544 [Reticulomyxa filosa]|uniref:DNA replication factor Cdt1 C-terminal domain-containing protein n=1 Tax=Reticulomyxa filosa TaxID=46433 RepID=X6N6H7_RETFI|nr:hypothetical protein RFI_15544 [Reticulomyxa filosa]|eukprot:ETO21656.1 hypothetical protein RFI_15544 [Reticulomyxa filosa]